MKRSFFGGKVEMDFKSLRFKLWVYFALLAVSIIALVWFLQIFFINNYYQEMKISETNKMAQHLILEYGKETFEDTLADLSASSDVYIHIETNEGFVLYSPFFSGNMPETYSYLQQLQKVRDQLIKADTNSVSVIIKDNRTQYDTLGYACELASVGGSFVRLFIFSPLYPVESTLNILKNQLFYVTVISLLLSFAIGVYLAARISRPLQNITNSAKQLAKGKFGITFKGENYTEIINLADTLTYTSLELEKASSQQRDMMANVSHDLKTPLTMVKSYAELIRDISGDNPEKRNAHLQVIIDEADRLNRLVSDMLTLSRMQTGAIILEKKSFSIKEAMESIISSFEIFTEREGYTILLDCPEDAEINADEDRIKQVLSNLLTNAIKYCGNDRTVIASVKLLHGKVRCEITDHGMGIEKEEQGRIWDRYYKASTNHVRATSGSGLGLSIVKEILLLHNAEFGVESRVGSGSTFWFEIKTEH